MSCPPTGRSGCAASSGVLLTELVFGPDDPALSRANATMTLLFSPAQWTTIWLWESFRLAWGTTQELEPKAALRVENGRTQDTECLFRLMKNWEEFPIAEHAHTRQANGTDFFLSAITTTDYAAVCSLLVTFNCCTSADILKMFAVATKWNAYLGLPLPTCYLQQHFKK